MDTLPDWLRQCPQTIRPTGSALWALGGIVIGGLLTSFLNRLNWHKDNRKLEYKELVDGLGERVEQILKARPDRNKKSADLAGLNRAVNSGFGLIRTRVFIRRRRLKKVESAWTQIQRCAQWDADDVQTDPKVPLIPYDQMKLETIWRNVEREMIGMCRADMKPWRF